MKPWDKVRREILGAWRSVRYDLDHRSAAGTESKPDLEATRRAVVAPTIGFDGANTPVGFGGVNAPGPVDTLPPDWYSGALPKRESIWAPLRDPRRVTSALAVATVIAASATGAFFAVSGGMGVRLVNAPGSSPISQLAPADQPKAATSTPTRRQVPVPRASSAAARVSPTPSAQLSASASPSPSASRSAVPSPSSSAGQKSASPSPSGSAAPSGSPTPDPAP